MGKPIRRATTLAALLLASSLPTRAYAQSAGLVTRMSASSAGVEGDGTSNSPSISADGRYVAFASAATNLVPGDTNDNSDVFVHDTVTGVVQRVSLTWNAMEARDDSDCPSISADGRHVAFLSSAWNMYPGGANLGRFRRDVYLHDRQAGTTTRISVAADGTDPDGSSDCPSISADGTRIVFASRAGNLVRRDDNRTWDVFLFDVAKQKMKLISKTADGRSGDAYSLRPHVSADGSAVTFVTTASNLEGAPLPGGPLGRLQRCILRDIEAGTTEVVDVTPLQPGEKPNGSCLDVVPSGDGAVVAFMSEATNLVSPAAPFDYFTNILVRDRAAAKTVIASRADPLLDDCSTQPGLQRCMPGYAMLPAISADGRWVTFTSYSQRLLPASLSSAPQTYLFDVLGHRLRRISVDPTGYENGCSGESALSSDGKVVALASDAGSIPQANPRRDVYRHEWTRVADGRRRPDVACPAQPTACAPATSAVFRLRKRPPGGVNEDRLFWRWNGAGGPPLPDPTAGAHYQLCIYGGPGGAVAMDVGTPDAVDCPAGDAPCWQVGQLSQKLRDPNGALDTLTVFGGDSASRIRVRGHGDLLDAPFLPLTGTGGLTVQLQDVASGRCWGADFPASAISKNFGGEPVSRRDGWLVAELR